MPYFYSVAAFTSLLLSCTHIILTIVCVAKVSSFNNLLFVGQFGLCFLFHDAPAAIEFDDGDDCVGSDSGRW